MSQQFRNVSINNLALSLSFFAQSMNVNNTMHIHRETLSVSMQIDPLHSLKPLYK